MKSRTAKTICVIGGIIAGLIIGVFAGIVVWAILAYFLTRSD